MTFRAAIAGVLAVGLAATPAVAAEVFVNGVKVTGALKGQKLTNVEIQFDAQGDLHVTAPGYKVEVEGPGAAPSAPPPGRQVWLIVNVPAPGHYKLAIQANTAPPLEIPPHTSQYVKDVTPSLLPGPNGMLFTFYPQPGAPVGPVRDAVDILVGEGGKAADGTLTISRVLATVKRKTGAPSAEAVPVRFELSP